MTFSPFLLSIAMWMLVFTAYGQAGQNWRAAHAGAGWRHGRTWAGALTHSFQRLWAQPAYSFFLLLLLMPAISGFWSADQGFWLERTRVRLPFLVLPWAFANLPPLAPRHTRVLCDVLVWALVLICIGVGINFWLHYDAIMDGMSRGQPIPVPRHHIRFSLMLATGIIAGGWRCMSLAPSPYRRVLGLAVVFLFIFIHVLSVRSGLASLYAALIFSTLRFAWRSRRWVFGLSAVATLILAGWLAFRFIPSLTQRVEYMFWDWGQFRENKGVNYSDAERWVSLKVGWQLWQEHPLLGVGAGDLRNETARLTAENFPHYARTPKLPHNQFLYILAGTGLVGLAFSLLAFLAPMLFGRYRHDPLFLAFQIMVLVSFLVEYTIETSAGVAWYLFYTLWWMKRVEGGREKVEGRGWRA